jgi:hypothetical protein
MVQDDDLRSSRNRSKRGERWTEGRTSVHAKSMYTDSIELDGRRVVSIGIFREGLEMLEGSSADDREEIWRRSPRTLLSSTSASMRLQSIGIYLHAAMTAIHPHL